MSNQRNRLPVNKSNEHSNNLNNLEKLNEYSNDLSDSEQYSNISNKLDQYSNCENNEVKSLHDNVNSKNLEDYKNYLHDNDNDLMNSDNDKEYKLFESRSQSFEGASTDYKELAKILKLGVVVNGVVVNRVVFNEVVINRVVVNGVVVNGVVVNGVVVTRVVVNGVVVTGIVIDKAIKFARIRSIVKVNERQLLKVDPLVLYHELPGHLRSSNRKTHGMDMELWLVEGQECLIIPEDITQINVWLKDLDRPVEYEYFVTEILYGFNGRLGVTADLLQGNDPASVLRHNANYGCRTSSQYGLSKKPVLNKLYWNKHLQTLQDAYHALAGKAAIEIIEHLKNIYQLTCNNHAIIKLIELWVVEAKLLKLAFSTTMTNYHFPTTANKISNFSSDNLLYSILYKWCTIDSNFKNINDDDIEKVNIISNLIPKKFINIVLWNKWSKTRTNNEGWSTKLSSQHPLFHDLQLTYSEYFSIRSAFLYDKLDFFNYILYTIIENNKKSNQLKFHVGDIIEIEEESEGLTYAKIQAILQHQANNTESAIFFVLKWFQKTNTKDLILDCLYYKQIMNDQQFFRNYLITCINCVQKIQFLPIQNNQKYIKNEFYYEAI
ncbi:hypothetical protein C2G38_2182404 [Gigaspora rosea]|uniref:Uncharacterized protein n=1 Tax=Gigaspora rosea TaxID=44941 RepID=A0A397VB56_9GLOM|nr:hypothetical protein C2G38_2182404 [Gigaspora rosea]